MKKMRYFIIFGFFLVFSISNDLKAQPGCPNVDAGPDTTLSCATPCTNLTATVLATGATTSYTVSSIPYAPPYPYTTGTSILINTDDIWGPVINIPFTFCFYGTSYTQLVVGSNGCISFGPGNANAYCAWSYTVSCPNPNIISGSTGPYILAPYQDINPYYGGTIKWALLGTAPCRTFVVSWNQIPEFSCTNLLSTSQAVLYESTNVVEVYIQNKPICGSWNGGRATLGIQNQNGTQGICPPGRNTGQWTAQNEAWRFTPSGTQNYTLSWWEGGTQIGTTPTINVCPTTTTTYVAQVVYALCTGNNLTLTDSVTVNANSMGLAITPIDPILCNGDSTTLTASTITPNPTFQWSNGSSAASITVTPATTTTYTVTATTPGCTNQATVVVTVNPNPVVNVVNATICNGDQAMLVASGADTYSWNTGNTSDSLIVSPSATTIYTVTGTTLGCIGTSNGTVTVNEQPTVTATNTNESCGNSNGTAIANPTSCSSYSYLWSDGQTNSPAINLSAGTYTVTVTCFGGCTATAQTTITNIPGPSLSISNITNSTCGLSNGSATVQAINGTPPYSYLWNTPIPMQTTPTMVNVPAGVYDVSVTDSYGCLATSSATITTTTVPIPSIVNVQNAGCNQSNGGAMLSVTDGTLPFIFNWNSNPPQSSQDLANVPTGNYNVNITDINGCTSSTTVFVPEDPGPSAITTTVDEICFRSDGSATVLASGGTGSYTYIWSTMPPQTSTTAIGLPSGVYYVTVDDGFCSTVANATVQNIPGPIAEFSTNPNVAYGTETPVYFTSNSSQNVVSWQWDFGDGYSGNGSTNYHLYPDFGTYIVTLVVTDNNGCTDTITDSVEIKDLFAFYIPSAFTPNGNGVNDYWQPTGNFYNPNNYDCRIFDRWGKLIFHTTDINERWDGTINNDGDMDHLVMDVYVYRIVVGEKEGNKKHEFIGRITLIP